jgi:hypothetical protein
METTIEHKYNIGDKVYSVCMNHQEVWKSRIFEETIKAIAFDRNNKIRYILKEGTDYNNNGPEGLFLATKEEAIKKLKERLLDLFNYSHERNIQSIDKILDKVNSLEE